MVWPRNPFFISTVFYQN